MLPIRNFVVVILVVGIVNEEAEAINLQNLHYRVRRQSEDGNGDIVDNIFNIPITAIRQTAAAAQSLYPDGSSAIDTVFNIPVATLEAVGNLVKTRNSLAQRRPMDGGSAADIKKRRKERKDRILAQRKAQRLQHNDPLGVNALTDLLVGNHGLLSGHGVRGGHHGLFGDHLSGNWGSHLISHFSGHGSSHGSSHGDGDSDDHDDVGEVEDSPVSSISSSIDMNDDGYAVTEELDEDRSGWGSWFNFGNLFGGSSSNSRAQNKIAPRPDRREYGRYKEQDAPLENKVAPKYERTSYRRSQAERPLENKIAPKNERRNYRRNYDDPPLQDRVAPRRGGRDGFVFEHRSL